MKRLTALLVIAVWILLLGFLAANFAVAQGQNLLTNPGFEPPFVGLGVGDPPNQIAQGWQPWHIGGGASESENIRPDYYAATDANGLGTPRVRSGSDAQQYFTWFATHDGGVYQRVTGITAGVQLRFSVYIYVWSSTFNDVNRSEDPGGVVVQVGIDPTGGTDGASTNVVWSAPSLQYDAYNLYTVTAAASGSAVTVFVRSTVTDPIQNNNIYVDDASLVVEGQQVPATATATVTSTFTVMPAATNTPLPPTNTAAAPATATSSVPVTATLPPTPTPPATLTPLATFTPITPMPTVTGVPTTAPGAFQGSVIHVVRSGDTVGSLATLYGSSVEAIVSANGLNNSALIRVGQALVIPVRLPAPATSTPTATSPAPVVPTAPPMVQPPQPNVVIHTVQPGDTLGRIAARYNTTIAAIVQLNGITNPNIVRVGQQLVIPVGQSGGVVSPPVVQPQPPAAAPPVGGQTYVVRPGDTLFRIAIRFRVSVSRLIQSNGILDPNRIFVGQVLVIPA